MTKKEEKEECQFCGTDKEIYRVNLTAIPVDDNEGVNFTFYRPLCKPCMEYHNIYRGVMNGL